MKRLYYRLIKDPGLMSDFICAYTWGQWSHTEFVIKEGYLGARLSGGVAIRPFDYVTPVDQVFKYVNLTQDNYDTAMTFIKEQIGLPYNWLAILGIGLRLDLKNDTRSWFCSEYVQAGFNIAQTPLLDTKKVYRITPRDIGLSTVGISDPSFNPQTAKWD
jgi:uncharacterized protein YycO